MQLDSNALLAFNRLRGSCPSFGNGVVMPSRVVVEMLIYSAKLTTASFLVAVCGCRVRLKRAIARNRGREENILFSAA
jgi:hypothetical protein